MIKSKSILTNIGHSSKKKTFDKSPVLHVIHFIYPSVPFFDFSSSASSNKAVKYSWMRACKITNSFPLTFYPFYTLFLPDISLRFVT